MVRLCDDLRREMDWIIVDCPAGIERGFRNAIAPADIVVVVTNPEVSAVRDADRIIGLIEAEEKGPARLVINRLNPGLVKQGNMLSSEDVLELLAVELIGIVPEDESVIISTNRGQPVALDPKSRAGQAFQNIARRLKGEKVEFLDLEVKDGFIHKLTRIFRPGGN
jgi:septum site-determining protein MinD